jgi:prepilin-type N-terminal cleavage/methylation domain-containing protein/prepilin-type processing-associated H-X9-DG protein
MLTHLLLMKTVIPRKKDGFTLIELLVVIIIIATLAALSFTVGPRMMIQAKANAGLQNLRQIGPLISTYASDHQMKLPPAKGPIIQSDGTTLDVQWNEVCLALLYPDTPPADFKTKVWWEDNRVVLNNPLFKEAATPRGWSPLNSGYAMNEMIPENLALASTGVLLPHVELLAVSVPLAAIADPGRTPLIAPCDNFFFRYDEAQLKEFDSGTLKELMTDGKIPVLFVDGHIETISPNDYRERKLYLVPIVPIP